MLTDFRLIPLQCPHCGGPLEAEECSVVFYCLQCLKGIEAAEREKKFLAYPLSFAAPKNAGAMNESPPYYLPFWMVEAQIEIVGRQYTRHDLEFEYWRIVRAQTEKSLTKDDQELIPGDPTVDFRIFVPAFPTTNVAAYTANLGVTLTKARPVFEPLLAPPSPANGKPAHPLPCIYDAQEALTLAEIIFMAMETREIANLLRVEFHLKALKQELWILPFYRQENYLVEPQTGAQMLAAGVEKQGSGVGD